MSLAICPICHLAKSLNEFGVCNARKDGRNLYCSSCIRRKRTEQRVASRDYREKRKSPRVIANAQAKALALSEPAKDVKPRRAHPERPIDARPEHFKQPWPTVRTQTFVEMVFGSIKKQGPCTREDILKDTQLQEDTIGLALADLLLWQKSVVTKIDELEDTRFFFVK